VESEVGDLIPPVIGLGLEIGEIANGSQGPEVGSNVMDSSLFDLALFLGLGDVTGNGNDLEGPKKLQKGLVEAHQGTLPLQDRRDHMVMPEFFGGALKKAKGVEQTAVQGVVV
jgi:hypothetical protein